MTPTSGRSALAAALALSLATSPSLSAQQTRGQERPQRGGLPNPDTPSILVSAFVASSRPLGLEVADELRSRIQSEHSAKELYATRKTTIDDALLSSGFPPDSALGVLDLMELARMTRAAYVVEGSAEKVGSSLHVESRLLVKVGTQTLAQPLPIVDGKDAGDVAKTVDRNISDALRGMPAYQACINDLRLEKYEQAVKDGDVSLAAYAGSTLARICLLQAYDKLEKPDSVIAIANAILAKDSTSGQALINIADAYRAKGDKERVAFFSDKICDLDLTNVSNCRTAVDALMAVDSLVLARRRIDMMLAQRPEEVELLRVKTLIELRAGQWKAAIAAGEKLMKIDSSAGTSDLFNRLIGAAQKDTNLTKIIELTSRAGTKFPTDISYQLLMAQSYRKAGQLPDAMDAVRHAIALDPKNTDAVVIAVNIARDMTQPDTAAAFAMRGIAAGADRDTLEPVLLGPVVAAEKKAEASTQRADWEAALRSAESLDALAPSAAAKFFVGVSSFQVGLDALQNAPKLAGERGKDARPKACAEATVLENMWAKAQIAIVAGGTFNRENAAQIMGAIQKYNEYIPQMKRAYCAVRD